MPMGTKMANTQRSVANVDLGPYKAQGMALAAARGTNLTFLLKELLADRISRMLASGGEADLTKRYKAELRRLRKLEG